MISPEEQFHIIQSGTAEIVPEAALMEKLKRGKPPILEDEDTSLNGSADDAQNSTWQRAVSPLGATAPIPHGGSIGKHGLGLPLIARIVLVHDGTLTIASAEGEGFSIIMTFPLTKESLH